jgi:hypothetical protein
MHPMPPAGKDVSVSAKTAPEETGEPTIYTIPDQFYGTALQARIKNPVTAAAPEVTKKSPVWLWPAVGGVALLFLVAGGFVYMNWDLLFGPPPAPPVQEPPPPPPPPPAPEAPVTLVATSTAPTVVTLSWRDISANESGFRVERHASGTVAFSPLTSLPPNASAFVDVAVQPQTAYTYRVIAVNASGDSAPSNEASAQTPAVPPPPPEPAKLPPAGLDSDSDGLTDVEEPLYGSPVRDPDADKDSFLDGNEVFHLYTPSGRAPGRLLDSGLVKAIESPMGWRLYVPTRWQSTLATDGRGATILTGHGETFTVRVEDNATGVSLLEWYLAKHPGTLSSQVTSVVTKSGYEGLEGTDLLTTYFLWGSFVLSIQYDLAEQPFVNFRTTYEMVKNSLWLSPTPEPLTPAVTAPAVNTPGLTPVSPTSTEGAASSSAALSTRQAIQTLTS